MSPGIVRSSMVAAEETRELMDSAAASQHQPPEPSPRRSRTLRAGGARLSLAAMAWYSSALLHLTGYAAAVGIFYVLGLNLIQAPDDVVDALAASLADDDVEHDAARLELATDISVGIDPDLPQSGVPASVLTISDAGWIDSLKSAATQSLATTDTVEQTDGGGTGFHFRVPEGGLAVTKGSFTAWTDPANPGPLENYLIIIEIHLPDGVRAFRLNDLSGDVRGTDDYRQRIPYDSNAPMASAVKTAEGLRRIRTSDQIDVVANKVQLAIKVPGAKRRMVRDTIRIRSRRLREEQELTLVFGAIVNPEKESPDATIEADADEP